MTAATHSPRRATDYRDLLLAGRWFRSVPAPFQEALLEMSHLRRVAAHELVVPRVSSSPSPPGCDLFAVVEGQVRVSRAAGDGTEVVLTILEPPGWAGEPALFDGACRTYDLTAETDAAIVEVPTARLHAFLDREPQHWRDLGRLMASKLRLAFLGMDEGGRASVRQRVAHRLLMAADGYGEWTDRVYPLVRVRQETMALMVGSSRQSVNLALRALEGEGLVKLGYGGVEVLDRERLRDAARL
jgi:CRP-like cAMP-binding protein